MYAVLLIEMTSRLARTCDCVSWLRTLALRLRQAECMLREARVTSARTCDKSRSVALFISLNWRRKATTARHRCSRRECSLLKYSLNDCNATCACSYMYMYINTYIYMYTVHVHTLVYSNDEVMFVVYAQFHNINITASMVSEPALTLKAYTDISTHAAHTHLFLLTPLSLLRLELLASALPVLSQLVDVAGQLLVGSCRLVQLLAQHRVDVRQARRPVNNT